MPTDAAKPTPERKRSPHWWGDYAPAIGEITSIAFGPSRILICRREREWQVLASTSTPEPSGEVRPQVATAKSMPADADMQRFVFSDTEPKLTVSPALADRPVVARPANALSIPPGIAVRLYVSSPLWLSAEVHAHAVSVLDAPIFRPSDLWFGPNTLEGRLCYSSLTHAHIDAANLLHRQHRAITPVVVKNDDTEIFHLERISLPVPYLSIFASGSGEIWTDVVTVVCGKGGETASLDISGKMPKEAGKGIRLRKPRENRPAASLLHTIHEWLG
jgi:hypothetical protein